jgi:hypothetical protein
MIRALLGAAALAVTLPAAAQSVPAANYTDMWWNPAESGWGLSFTQHAATTKAYAVWYTYDPREPDTSTSDPADFKPLWFVMPGGSWTTPTSLTGQVYVTDGTPFAQAWVMQNHHAQLVGSFTFNFSDASHGKFTYNIAPPAGLPSTNPAFGLPTFSGTKSIERNIF